MKQEEPDKKPSVTIIGVVGVPGTYGGFETLADELIQYAEEQGVSSEFIVYCSGQKPDGPLDYCGAERRFVAISANGIASILYDILTCLHAWWCGATKLLILGVSGAPVLLFLRLFTRVELITNVDGVEWKRAKWNGLAKTYLRLAEWLAVRLSHHVIADNQGIQDYLEEAYACSSTVITYGGDHALKGKAVDLPFAVPDRYAISVCRIEPENNVHLILKAFADSSELSIVFVGNWDATPYGRELWERYSDCDNIILSRPIYDQNLLYTLRRQACTYVHGHSAGGTNPSLVEMMHFGIPIIAFDCNFNRYTTDGEACYFASAEELVLRITQIFDKPDNSDAELTDGMGAKMANIARTRYVWSKVGEHYLDLLKVRVVD